MKRLLTVCVCGLMAQATFAAAPTVAFVSPGPGLHAPLDDDTAPDTYGKWQSGNSWTMDGDSASADAAVAPLAYGRYLTTLEGEESMTAMPTDQDWVLEIVQKHTGDYNPESAWFTKNWDADTRMVMLNCVGDDDWILRVGNASGGWDIVADGLSLGEDWNTFTVHYKAGEGKLDAYQNGALIAGDFETGHGLYDLNHIQFETLRMGTDWYQSIKIGQVGGDGPVCNPGDADDDGDVDDDDLSLLLANWGADTDCAHGEFSDEAPVNDDDLSLLLANWTGAVAAVPEPATMLLFGLAVPTLLKMRRKA